MKILYGIQGTGNGHMTRARLMAEALANADIDTDYLISGRSREQLFDMQPFGDFACRQGLTFSYQQGRIDSWRTLREANLRQLWRDIRELDLAGYDLVITDFEPVTAWAARWRGVPSLALSHQASFRYDVPKRGFDLGARLLMKLFAPATEHVGLHWHHFQQPLLPPVIDTAHGAEEAQADKILVYLPFEDVAEIERLLILQPATSFFCYHPQVSVARQAANVCWLPLSRQQFVRDLADAAGVICNSGFELPSEALFLGKKLLVKPLQGQFEQESNAATLTSMRLAMVMNTLCGDTLGNFLQRPPATPVRYPDVAAAIAGWLTQPQRPPLQRLADQLWQQVGV